MKIASVEVKDFKRFSDLRIESIPPEARLVMLVGPNGCGKSSLFEAFNYWIAKAKGSINYAPDYHDKASAAVGPAPHWSTTMQRIKIRFHDFADDPRDNSEVQKRIFYLRSAYRHESDFSSDRFARIGEMLDDAQRPATMIDGETRVSSNYQRIVASTIEAVFDPANSSETVLKVRDRLIGRIRDSMARIFPDLLLSGVGRPGEIGTFVFDKGIARGFRYKNLSGGEKAAFDLILDFIVKCEIFDNTVICIDEPELHMHTRLQSQLLEELLRQLPANCQLWIATHSVGMARCAMNLCRENPHDVAFLDFDGRDFDERQVVSPVPANRLLWRRVFSVALGDVIELVAPRELILCEGRRLTQGASDGFDALVYRRIFSLRHPETEFLSMGGADEIQSNLGWLSAVFARLTSGTRVWSVVDRDDRNTSEIEELAASGTRVLSRRDIESFLWDDEVIEALVLKYGTGAETHEIVREKHRLMTESTQSGQPADDVKRIAGPLYNFVRMKLSLVGLGNNANAFARDTLAQFIVPGMSVYGQLERDVFGGQNEA